ncbi:cytosolic 5'-nucleotidase 3-like isoform X3 [Homalodisca vitripennis]|nr:cytosolic 5'-nucleotidase 3-like isoform X3 [Homalodisca vitripennis]XP_046674507.1 cytosolic 5'-nucleotidase 3-like isoform X3 [Homalodisca vitripennis]XP_046674508.1 cytosolic 5'-nucleotidase 3-like isoform X3 [Homalodisca vitripennis]
MEELQQENVIIGDKEKFEKKLKNLVTDGMDKLQVIADFDGTLTKSIVDGKPALHSIDVFKNTATLSQAYRDGYNALAVKHGPAYENPNLSVEERQEVLYRWWEDHENLCAGEVMTLNDLLQSNDNINTPLRDGCEKMLRLLSDHQVPLIVVSAGLGEVVKYVLKEYKPRVVSNYITFDDNGRIKEFSRPTVSVFNKHMFPLPVDQERHNVVLLGDSIGDCNMADSVPDTKTVLKIGFFIGTDEKKLERYKSCYDLVLVEDQTMYTVTALLGRIAGRS